MWAIGPPKLVSPSLRNTRRTSTGEAPRSPRMAQAAVMSSFRPTTKGRGKRVSYYRQAAGFLQGGDPSRGAMHAVIFEVKPAGEHGQRAYLGQAARLAEQLRTVPGFVSIERFENTSRPGWVLSLSLW